MSRQYVPNVLVSYEVQHDDSTQTYDLFEENGDEWEVQTQAIIDSESDEEIEHEEQLFLYIILNFLFNTVLLL